MVIILKSGDDSVEYSFSVGIREIEKKCNKIFVNGKEIKLRGVCRHDVSAKYGRSISKEEAYAEITSYKNNNVNFIRTSHYPPGKYIMQACDELGIYVEVENAVCFKGGNGYNDYFAVEEMVQGMAEPNLEK